MPTVAAWRKRIQAVSDSFSPFVVDQALMLLPKTGFPHLSDLMVAAWKRQSDASVTELLIAADKRSE
jgi:hypothetical protein